MALGSLLGAHLSNLYIGTAEERVFEGTRRPKMYARYSDDYLLYYDALQDLDHLVQKFKGISMLQFITESGREGRFPVRDILVDTSSNKLKASVFTEAINNGAVKNATGECSSSDKKSGVAAFAKRAVAHCTTWQDLHHALERIRQLLT